MTKAQIRFPWPRRRRRKATLTRLSDSDRQHLLLVLHIFEQAFRTPANAHDDSWDRLQRIASDLRG